MSYWMADAEYLSVDDDVAWLIGKDENAEWWVPYQYPWRRSYLWIPFNRRNPMHWLRYWNSRRRNQVASLYA